MEVGSAAPLREMVIAAHALGIDLSAHRAGRIGSGELAQVDLVIGFEPFHVSAAVVEGGARPEVSFTLSELDSLVVPGDRATMAPSLDGKVAEIVRGWDHRRAGRSRLSAPSIDDPFGAGQRVFDRLAMEIDGLVDTVAGVLVGAARGELGQAGVR